MWLVRDGVWYPCACVRFARYLTLAQAQAKALKLDWSDPANKPFKPHMLGTKVLADYPIEEVVPYIDWNPFFQVWQLRGRYPNRGYPKIFNDPTVGSEAKKLFEEAQVMLKVSLQLGACQPCRNTSSRQSCVMYPAYCVAASALAAACGLARVHCRTSSTTSA